VPVPHSRLSRRFLITGIVLAAVGIVLTVFSADLLIGLGVQVSEAGLLGTVNVLSRIAMFFGLPLSAGFICLGIAFHYTWPDHSDLARVSSVDQPQQGNESGGGARG
jgi:hypothetical protein